MVAPSNGLATHDITTFLHDLPVDEISRLCWTSKTRPTPMMPPMMLCVVDTGRPSLVATVSQTAAAISGR